VSEDLLQQRVLVGLIREPWSSQSELANFLGMPFARVNDVCQALMASGSAQFCVHPSSPYAKTAFAPTPKGVAWCAHQMGTTSLALLKAHGFTEERFRLRRVCHDIVREVALFCSRLNSVIPMVYESFILRQMSGKTLILHARINLQSAKPRALYLLIDRGEETVWMWWRHLRYFEAWARRSNEPFPPLLILTTRDFRCTALLILARQLCPSVPVAASADREAALTQDPRQAAWMMLSGNRVIGVHPFEENSVWAPLTERHRAKPHTIRTTKTPSHDDPAICAWQFPSSLTALPAIESLSHDALNMLSFLTRHPVCSLDLLRTFSQLDDAQLQAVIEQFVTSRLADWHTDKTKPVLLSATVDAVCILATRTGSTMVEMSCHRFTQSRAEHLRRLQHTLDVQEIFMRLHRQAKQWSDVLRKVDAPVALANDGDIPHFELEVFEEDLHAAAHFTIAGIRRKWLPDGYGVLRAGEMWQPFWVELDGTRSSRSRVDPDAWQRKFDNVCAYQTTGKWRLRYTVFPMVLIVTHDLRNFSLICDIVTATAHGMDAAMPQVFVASWDALVQRGPLSPIWRAAHEGATPGFVQALPAMPMLTECANEAQAGQL
jgi:hypothetical protein